MPYWEIRESRIYFDVAGHQEENLRKAIRDRLFQWLEEEAKRRWLK